MLADGVPGVPFVLEPGYLDAGNALSGTNGNPELRGFGSLLGGSLITTELTNALPSSLAVLVLGFGIAPTPLVGGTLVPSLDIVVGPIRLRRHHRLLHHVAPLRHEACILDVPPDLGDRRCIFM